MQKNNNNTGVRVKSHILIKSMGTYVCFWKAPQYHHVLFLTSVPSCAVSQRKCNHHKFADNTQLHQSSAPSDFPSLIHNTEQCVDSVWSWMTGNRLKLNNNKTEALVVGSHRRVSVSQDSNLRVDSHDISFKSHVKSLFTLTLPCHWQTI